jgi:hypothetical protein
MKNTLSRFVLGVGACLALIPQSTLGQSKEGIPLPEFYGNYAIAGGKAIGIDSATASPGTVQVRIGHRTMGDKVCVPGTAIVTGAVPVPIPEMPPNVQFLVFYEPSGLATPMMAVRDMHLFIEGFVRNLQVDGCYSSKLDPISLRAEENAWDSSTGEVELRSKPVPGQQEMVLAVPATRLDPGVYSLSGGALKSPFVFAVSPVSIGEKTKCIDLTVQHSTWAIATGGVLSEKAVRCTGSTETTNPSVGGATPQPPAQSSVVSDTRPNSGIGAAVCSNYDACLQAAMNAYKSRDWGSATAAFEAAANQRPTSGEPWVWLGRILFMDNQPHQQSDLSNVWDKALSLGAELMIGACHELTLRPCERGDLALSTKSVSFLANGSQAVFSAAPADITPGRILNNSAATHISYSMKVANKNYAIDFIPLGTQECQFNLMVQCSPEGVTKQLVLAQYVSQTLPKLARGALTLTVTPVPPSPTPTTLAPPPSPSNSACGQAVDAGYSILLQGHLYKVKTTGPTGPNQISIFFDEKGAQVVDSNLLQQLATAAWTRENVVVSSDARNGSRRVSGILGTSKALQGYSTVQDALARAMVEAVEAGATGGVSLSKAVPNLTFGILKQQVMNSPKTLLTLAAQRGLENSLLAYTQMEAVPLPPADATALNAADLARIKDLYLQARSLELPFEALASKLMPTSASDLTEQALKSAFSELVDGPLFSGATQAAKLTLKGVLDLQKSVANLSGTLPALRAYSQDLNLALSLADANNRTISVAATNSASPCGMTGPTNASRSGNTPKAGCPRFRCSVPGS